MGCFGSKKLDSGIMIMYNGNMIELKQGEEYDFKRVVNLISQRTGKNSSILSISNSGNAFRIEDEKDFSSLNISKKKDVPMLLMVAPEELFDIFHIVTVKDKKLDLGFEAIAIKLKSLLKVIAAFNKNFTRFVLSLSQLFVRSCNIMTTITSLVVMLTPYLQEMSSDPPYIIIPEQVKTIMPQDIRNILDLWEKLLSLFEKIEEHLATLDNNLTFMLSGRVTARLRIFKDKKFDLKAFKIAENNVKVHKSLERVRDIRNKIHFFKDSVIQAINIQGDRRIDIVKRITLIGEKCKIDSPHQTSWVFGLGDYSIIPSDMRFY